MVYKKYFTMSFDDGLEQDKKLISIINQYDLKSTFNLNSGLFGEKQAVLRMGEIGFATVKNRRKFPASLFKGVDHHRIPRDEIVQVYEGHEVATHGQRHKLLITLSEDNLKHEITEDMNALTKLLGYEVTGHAYPGGGYNKAVIKCMRESGIAYARTAKSTQSFSLPQDPYKFNPTCWSHDKHIFELMDEFINTEPKGNDRVFCIAGHAYGFDYGTERGSWTHLEKICEKIAGHDDIVYCTNQEIFNRR
ncbi:hypothetical protein A8709_08590 [Paenibacillus pectinilyticus]|uniref:NodB homology domain-containing protein n=1 Tax=Paenibacillus pectinilyticus TaxID=512399 RepID=A0A1C1A7Z5_9BACL|nr:polysaccharide deacetylase family protein [Paenibacillus pectinilyticus]OCT16715.1 hypothetical protein A8709_08590 [Paenibacillus pectinilyticus]